MCVLVAQSCLTLCDPMGPSRLLCPWNSPVKNTGVGSHSLLKGIFSTQGSNPGLLHCRQILYQLSQREAQEYWSGWAIPSPADLPNSGIEARSPTLQADSLPAEPKGSPRILEWATYPLSRGSSRSRNRTGVSCLAGRFFTN